MYCTSETRKKLPILYSFRSRVNDELHCIFDNMSMRAPCVSGTSNQKCQKKKKINDLTRFLPYLNFSRFNNDAPCDTEVFDYIADYDAR